MSWILFLVEFYWIGSGVDYHRRIELWVEPSVLLSAFGNRELNRFWELIMNDLNWIESTWILVNPSELWIMKEVAVHITGSNSLMKFKKIVKYKIKALKQFFNDTTWIISKMIKNIYNFFHKILNKYTGNSDPVYLVIHRILTLWLYPCDSKERDSLFMCVYVLYIVSLVDLLWCITDESIELEISRTQPAAAQVSLLWTISGVGEHLPLRGFNQTSGLIMFEEVWISYYYNYE